MYLTRQNQMDGPVGLPRSRGFAAFHGTLGEIAPTFACSGPELTAIRTAIGNPGASVATLRATVAEALRRAVAAVNRAATLLEAHPRAAATVTQFRSVFGAGPDFVPTWRTAGARWADLGELVARRLRSVSRILAGNQIQFTCAGCDPTATACTTPPTYAMHFGMQFWQWSNAGLWHFLVSTLVHEATHIFFHRLTSHNPANRRAVNANPSARSNSPYCYALVTTRLNGFPDKPNDVARCATAD